MVSTRGMQKEAVYNAICEVFSREGLSKVAVANAQRYLTKKRRDMVVLVLTIGFEKGTIPLVDKPSNQEKLDDPVLLERYVENLISNWLKKDDRINGTNHPDDYKQAG